MLCDCLQNAVKGVVSIDAITNNWPAMARHICDTPRARTRRRIDDLETFNTKLHSLS
jgi:hypothetical protein